VGVRDQVLPAGLVLAGAVSVQSGAGIADRLFGQLPPASVTTLRLWAAALILLVVAGRGTARAVAGLAARRARTDAVITLTFGIALGFMNFAIYQAFARIPLGIAVTIEFLGPLSVTVTGTLRGPALGPPRDARHRRAAGPVHAHPDGRAQLRAVGAGRPLRRVAGTGLGRGRARAHRAGPAGRAGRARLRGAAVRAGGQPAAHADRRARDGRPGPADGAGGRDHARHRLGRLGRVPGQRAVLASRWGFLAAPRHPRSSE